MATSETLRSVIDAGRGSKRLDELSTARVIGKIAEQVHAAQLKAGAGKAIGPVTPASISISDTGEAKLGLTEPNAFGYSSPEQLGGAAGDRRSDVFSLGSVMWEALTHQRLFDAMNDAAVKVAVQEREIRPPAELNANIPAELSAICMKALARNPADRYQSAKVMAVEIDEVLSEAAYPDNNEKIAAYIGELSGTKKVPPPKPALPSITKPTAPPATLPAMAVPPPRPPATPPTQTMIGSPAGPAPAPVRDSPGSPVTLVSTPPGATVPAAAPAAPLASFAEPRPPVLPSAKTNGAGLESGPVGSVTRGGAEPAIKTPTKLEAPPVEAALVKEPSSPHPAAVVALPAPDSSRESQKLLANWAWQTDSVEAIDDDDDFGRPQSRKWLLYSAGTGLGLVLIITIIMVGFGKDKPANKPAPSAAAKEGSEPAAPAPVAPAGSDVGSAVAITGSDGSGSAAAVTPGPTTPPGPPAPIDPYADSGSAAATAGSNTAVKPEPPKPEPPKAEPPKPEPPKPEPPKVTKPDKVAKVEPPKPDKPKPHVAKAEPPKPKPPKPDAPKADVEASYRQGLQQFMRGDTTGALASLRTSLASNPNYPPTWRGLGLVFERLGEKDQARAAFKRYLQLAPNAADADQIRGRLERL